MIGTNEQLERMLARLVEESVVEMSDFSRYVELILLNLGCYFREEPEHLSSKLDELLCDFVENPYYYPYLFPQLDVVKSKSFIKYVLTSFIGRARSGRDTDPVPEDKECEHPKCRVRAEECDHILPYSWGGPNEEWNYQFLCRTHNRVKGSTLQSFAHKLHSDKDYENAFADWWKRTCPN